MNFNFNEVTLSDEEVAALDTAPAKTERSLTPPGRYDMTVKSVRARAMGDTGKFKAEIFFVHASDEHKALKGATLSLFRKKDNQSQNTIVATRQLEKLGVAAGLDKETARTMTWAIASGSEADEYGSLEAAIGAKLNGSYEVVSLEGITVPVLVDIETYPGGSKNIIKSVY